MPIVTLISDFGLKSYELAAIKASILAELPKAELMDISHNINPFDLNEAAYVIRNSYPFFPKKSVHLILIDSAITPSQKAICAKIDGQYFLSANNGVLSLISQEIQIEEAYEVNIQSHQHNNDLLSIFVPSACHLARGGEPSVIGKKIKTIKHLHHLQPVITEQKSIVGTVIFIDNYGNVVTNITKKIFDATKKQKNYLVKVRNHQFNEIVDTYSAVVKDFNREQEYHGKEMVLFNAAGFLEVAVYKSNPNTVGSASTLFGLKLGDNIKIEFN